MDSHIQCCKDLYLRRKKQLFVDEGSDCGVVKTFIWEGRNNSRNSLLNFINVVKTFI